jgi:cysteine-rich CPCC protein
MDPEQERLERRKRWFEWYVNQLDQRSVHQPRREGSTYRCPCCGCKTLPERGGDDICPVCFWEDDGQDDQDADVVRGGPNHALSLTQARANYRSFGACEERLLPHVRKPLPEEL